VTWLKGAQVLIENGGVNLEVQRAKKYLEYVWKLSAAAATRITALIELGRGWEAFAARLYPEKSPANRQDVARGGAK
jgi:hypothetical protein